MKIKIIRETHGLNPGEKTTVTAARGASMIAGNFAVEDGKNPMAASTLVTLNRRQLMGLAKGRNVKGYMAMQPGQLIAAMASTPPKTEAKKTVKKKAKKAK